MELNITKLFTECNPCDLSASQMEMGANVGAITWNNSMEAGAEFHPLKTEEERDALRAHVRGFGAWSEEEIAAWSDTELDAFLVQMVAGDMREAGLDSDAPDWEQYERDAHAGRVCGNIFRADDGAIYYYLGS
jgi:hypothetical protein